ncbi:MAG: hypothetical protein DYH06_18675 [Acidobacteria bacterium ACB2]|nr:hypothetical protein [Acidobacteria bacterium ACB2]
MRASGFVLAVAAASLLGAAPAPAQNLIANGSFADGLSSWSRLDAVSWSAFGAVTAGSARVAFPSRPEGGDALIQCVAVEGHRLYDLSAAAFLPGAPGASGGVSVRLSWHASPSCQSPSLRGAPSLDFSRKEPGGWQQAELRRIPAPEEAASALVVVVARSAGEDSYALFVDDLVLRRSVEEADVVLPTAASVTGARGERFETEPWVHNPAPAERFFTLRFRREGPETTPTVLRVGAGETRHLADVIRQAFGSHDRAGAIVASYDPGGGPMLFEARVVTVHPGSPGNGAGLPVLPRSAARTSALFSGLSGARGDAAGAFRVNAGAWNPHEAPVDLLLELHDGDGTHLGTVKRVLGPGEWLQVNDVFAEAGAAGLATEGAWLAAFSRLPVFPFAIVVDNRSGDATVLPAADVPVVP